MANSSLLLREYFDAPKPRPLGAEAPDSLVGRRAPAVSPAPCDTIAVDKDGSFSGFPSLHPQLANINNLHQPRCPSPVDQDETLTTLPIAAGSSSHIVVVSGNCSHDDSATVAHGGHSLDGLEDAELAKMRCTPTLSAGRSTVVGGARSGRSSTSTDSDISRSTTVMYDDEEEALMNELLSYDSTPQLDAVTQTAITETRKTAVECLPDALLVSRDDTEVGRFSSQGNGAPVVADYEKELEEKMQECLTAGAATDKEISGGHSILKRHHSAPSLTPTSSRKFLNVRILIFSIDSIAISMFCLRFSLVKLFVCTADGERTSKSPA